MSLGGAEFWERTCDYGLHGGIDCNPWRNARVLRIGNTCHQGEMGVLGGLDRGLALHGDGTCH